MPIEVIAHLLHTHTPFIGDTRIEELTYGQLAPGEEKIEPNELLEDVTVDTVQKTYYDNRLRIWTDDVEPLLKRYHERWVVVTADHG